MRPQILNPLFASVSTLPGIGPKLTKTLTRLLRGNENEEEARIVDLLFHAPHSVIDRRNQPGITNALNGAIATFQVHVDRHLPPPRGNRRVPYRIDVHDDTGELSLVFFHPRADWLEKAMPVGEKRYISGRVEWFNGKLNMVHPDYMVSETEFAELPLMEPVYGTTFGLSSKILSRSVRSAVASLPEFPEWADDALVSREHWPSFNSAVKRIHKPVDALDLDPKSPARRRLAHDELLAGQLSLALLRHRMRKSAGISRVGDKSLVHKIEAALPYTLTGAQQRAIGEISQDLQKPERMLRLLQGDVGSGKTIVALIAMVEVIETGSQAAIMAPTEILARQHIASIKPLCEAASIKAVLLTGREKGKTRKEILQALEAGEIHLLVGTHALFQSDVVFKDLGLAVIDEQHRFGVHQRLSLGDKGMATDVLVMTATPIPRTLVLTAYGDMDVSRLDEKPPGRQPIKTSALSAERLPELIQRIENAISHGQKAYWICPLVEESEVIQAMSAEDRFASLKAQIGIRVGLVHGRMTTEEKSKAMDSFKSGETRLLVATTVIEVGVDVPDATIMVIEHAERFGLAQLHQLRGRVGRGEEASHCILVYSAPLGETAKARIGVMRETEDGFRIAEEDLKLRGEGEVLGTRQSGMPGFNLAVMEHHSDILEFARDGARLLIHSNPDLEGSQGEALRMLLYLFGQDQAIRLLRAG